MLWRARGAWWLMGIALCLTMGSGCGYLDGDMALSDEAFAASLGEEAESRTISLEDMVLYGRIHGCGGGWGYRSGYRTPRVRVGQVTTITGEATLDGAHVSGGLGALSAQQALGGQAGYVANDPGADQREAPPRDVLDALSKRHQRFAAEVTGKLAAR